MRRSSPVLLAVMLLGSACGRKDAPVGNAEPPATAAKAGTSDTPLDDYRRKSMAVEARVGVKMMAKAARAHFESEHSSATGESAPASSLPPAPMTPAAGSCCKLPKGVCPPEADTWRHATWQALGFEQYDPFRYSYEFVSSPTGFVARAVGDLDCDGTFSTFEVTGTVGPAGVQVSDVVAKDEMEWAWRCWAAPPAPMTPAAASCCKLPTPGGTRPGRALGFEQYEPSATRVRVRLESDRLVARAVGDRWATAWRRRRWGEQTDVV
jgi:hypothetical protein